MIGKRLFLMLLAVLVAFGSWWAWRFFVPGEVPRGTALYARGEWSAAREQAWQRLKAAPNDANAIRLVARSSARLGQFAEASRSYMRVAPDAFEAEDYYVLGAGFLRANKVSDALASFEKALAKDPNHPEALRDLVKLYIEKDRLTDALDVARRLGRQRGWEAAGAVGLGAVDDALDERAAAAAAFTNALELDPSVSRAPITFREVRLRLAGDLLRTSRPAEARSQLTPLLNRGADPEASFLLSRCYLQEGKLTEATSAWGQSNGSSRNPMAEEPAPNVGSARCAECHQAIHDVQQKTRHARTFKTPDELRALTLPAGPVVDPGDPSVSHTISRVDDKLKFETRRKDGAIYRAIVDFALGASDHGLTLVGRDGDSKSYELRLSVYGKEFGWDRTTGQPVKPPDGAECLGRSLNADAVRNCVNCHATEARAALDRTGPAAADHGIGCERCHGPAGNHLAAVSLGFPDLAIARPKLAPGAPVMALCGQCHTAKGKDLHPLQPEAIRFQALTLAASACFTNSEGKLDCVTCHNPHRNVSKSHTAYEAACLECHSERPNNTPGARGPRSPAESMRRVVCKVNSVSGCIECHMPASSGRALHASFTDHYIRIHPEKAAAPSE